MTVSTAVIRVDEQVDGDRLHLRVWLGDVISPNGPALAEAEIVVAGDCEPEVTLSTFAVPHGRKRPYLLRRLTDAVFEQATLVGASRLVIDPALAPAASRRLAQLLEAGGAITDEHGRWSCSP